MDIKALREAKGWTKLELAQKIGVTEMTIYRWETDKAKPHSEFQKKLDKILKQEEA